ncbi:TPA: metallophosphoesterase family protein [Staphylococcus aureus]
MIYFISDTHFYHKTLAIKNRKFDSVEQMNQHIIKNWNETVSDDDDIYILGDLFYRSSIENANSILKLLNGNKYLVVGNHDKHYLSNENFKTDIFKQISEIIEFKSHNYLWVLCHYPLLEWNQKHYNNSIHLYGHVHDFKPEYYNKILGSNAVNVSCELIKYTPISIEQVLHNLNINL